MNGNGQEFPNFPPPPQGPKSGSIGAGFLLGILTLLAVYVGGGVGQRPYAPSGTFLSLPNPFLPVLIYMAAAIVLAVVPRTARYGAGLLIGMGFFILVDGFCLGILSRAGSPA